MITKKCSTYRCPSCWRETSAEPARVVKCKCNTVMLEVMKGVICKTK